MDISNFILFLFCICWIMTGVFFVNDHKEFAFICFIFTYVLLCTKIYLNNDENSTNGLYESDVMLDDKFNYKAELKSGEIVDAISCGTVNDKAICQIHINGKSTDYVVTSYELINALEIK